jgi:hypothetical protein
MNYQAWLLHIKIMVNWRSLGVFLIRGSSFFLGQNDEDLINP